MNQFYPWKKLFICLKLRRNSIFTLNLCYWKSISIRPGQTGLCQSNPHSFMPLSLCDVSVLLHGIITSNTAEAFFLYFCCKAIREQTEVAYDLIGPTQYQRRKRYRILNFKSHTTHYPFFHGQTTQNLSTKWVPKSSSWKVFGIKHPQTLKLLSRRGPRCPDMRLSQHYIGPKNDILSFFNFLQKKVSFLFQKLFMGFIFCFLGNSFGWCQISFFFRDNGIVIFVSIA